LVLSLSKWKVRDNEDDHVRPKQVEEFVFWMTSLGFEKKFKGQFLCFFKK